MFRNLFKYSYRLTPTAKSEVYYLSPTPSTYAKAFAPAVIIWGVIGISYAAHTSVERRAARLEKKLREQNLVK